MHQNNIFSISSRLTVSVRAYEEDEPFPVLYTDQQILDRYRDAMQRDDCKPNTAAQKQFYKCTDHGNAERFTDQHGNKFRYCQGQWYNYNGRYWGEDNTFEHMRCAMRTARLQYKEAEQCNDDGKRRALAKWAAKSDSNTSMRNMVSLARHKNPVATHPDAFDPDLAGTGF